MSLDVVEFSLSKINGLDGKQLSNNQRRLTVLNSNADKCVSFAFLSAKGVQRYTIGVKKFAMQGINPLLRGIMSLPNQTRSFDRFKLFGNTFLPENKQTDVGYLVHSPKFLQKRNTGEEPCVDVDNYDKVMWENGLAKCIVNFSFESVLDHGFFAMYSRVQ